MVVEKCSGVDACIGGVVLMKEKGRTVVMKAICSQRS